VILEDEIPLEPEIEVPEETGPTEDMVPEDTSSPEVTILEDRIHSENEAPEETALPEVVIPEDESLSDLEDEIPLEPMPTPEVVIPK